MCVGQALLRSVLVDAMRLHSRTRATRFVTHCIRKMTKPVVEFANAAHGKRRIGKGKRDAAPLEAVPTVINDCSNQARLAPLSNVDEA